MVGSQTKLTETLDPCQVRPGNYVLLTELNDKRTTPSLKWWTIELKV
jgi:hypothetical protein